MATQPQTSDALEALRLLLDGISAHAVFDNSEEYTALRREFSRLRGQLNSDRDAIRVVRTALNQLLAHNARVTRSVRTVRSALPSILSRLTASLQSVHEINESTFGRLETIQKQLAESSSAADLESLRSSLALLLESAKFDGLKQSSLVSDTISQVIRDCRQFAELPVEPEATAVADDSAARNVDSLTGLPNRARAERAIVQLVKEEGAYVSVFHLNRLPLIQSRFGIRGRDQAVLQFAQYLAQLLAEPDTLFRWAEAVFVGIVFDCISSGHVVYKEDLTLFLRAQQSVHLELGGRSALVSVLCRYRQFRLRSVAPDAVFRQIDAFVDGAAASAAEPG
jgi:GGDEF domain-containing protein